MPTVTKELEAAAKTLVDQLTKDPQLIHEPELASFKALLISGGFKVPPKAPEPEAKPKPSEPEAKPKPEPVPVPPEPEEEEEEDEPEEPEEEEEDPDRLPEDSGPFPEKGPPGELELTDEQLDKQGELKQEAAELLEDGNKEKALEKFTEAIKIGNVSAMMYCKRAEMLLKMKRPNASIEDCTSALAVNENSAKAFRIRGKAHRLLGHWEQAHLDLSQGQKLDYDDDTADMAKLVAEKNKKIAERKTRIRIKEEAKAKKKKEADYKRRKAEATRAYEEAKKREAEEQAAGFGGMGGMGGFPGMGGMGGMPGGMGGMPGGMGGMPGGVDPNLMAGLMSDPDLAAAFSNPKMMAAMQDIMSNPQNMAKYQSDPEIMGLMTKLMGKMGGMGGMPGGMGGMPGGFPGGMGGMPGGFPGGMPGSGGSGGSSSGPTVEEVPEYNTGADEVD